MLTRAHTTNFYRVCASSNCPFLLLLRCLRTVLLHLSYHFYLSLSFSASPFSSSLSLSLSLSDVFSSELSHSVLVPTTTDSSSSRSCLHDLIRLVVSHQLTHECCHVSPAPIDPSPLIFSFLDPAVLRTCRSSTGLFHRSPLCTDSHFLFSLPRPRTVFTPFSSLSRLPRVTNSFLFV